MGAKQSVPIKRETDLEIFLKKHKEEVAFEDLVVGRKYHVWNVRKVYYGEESNYEDEPITYDGFELENEEVFLKFKDRYRERYNGPRAAEYPGPLYPTKKKYKRQNIRVFESEESLRAQEAARILSFKLPEDVAHHIKGYAIGNDRRNRYPARIQQFKLNENYFTGGFIFNTFYTLFGGK